VDPAIDGVSTVDGERHNLYAGFLCLPLYNGLFYSRKVGSPHWTRFELSWPKYGSLEPVQLLSDQSHMGETGTRTQTG
jgi:hypothetical protein